MSVFTQHLLPRQIIISDDSSTDRTLEVVESCISLARSELLIPQELDIEIYRQSENVGVVQNFSFALSHVKQPNVVLCDQDDIWETNKLFDLSVISESLAVPYLIHTDAKLIEQTGKSLGLTLFDALNVKEHELMKMNSGRAIEVLARRNIVTGATVMFSKELISIAEPFPEFWLHDEWLAITAASVGGIYSSTRCTIDYRQHQNNVVGIRKLGLRHHIGRMIYPRTERNKILFARQANLVSHPSFELFSRFSKRVLEEKYLHEQVRSRLPNNRLRRIPLILSELLNLRYFRFGLGLSDAMRDFVQPE